MVQSEAPPRHSSGKTVYLAVTSVRSHHFLYLMLMAELAQQIQQLPPQFYLVYCACIQGYHFSLDHAQSISFIGTLYMRIYRYFMKIYKYSTRFRVPAVDISDHSICYN